VSKLSVHFYLKVNYSFEVRLCFRLWFCVPTILHLRCFIIVVLFWGWLCTRIHKVFITSAKTSFFQDTIFKNSLVKSK